MMRQPSAAIGAQRVHELVKEACPDLPFRAVRPHARRIARTAVDRLLRLEAEVAELKEAHKRVALRILDNDRAGLVKWAEGVQMKLGKPGEVVLDATPHG